jgi:hypothetical protein
MAALDNLRNSHTAEMLAVKATHTAELTAVKEDADRKIQYLQEQIVRLQRDNDNLWVENNRKSRIIDKLIEHQEANINKR